MLNDRQLVGILVRVVQQPLNEFRVDVGVRLFDRRVMAIARWSRVSPGTKY